VYSENLLLENPLSFPVSVEENGRAGFPPDVTSIPCRDDGLGKEAFFALASQDRFSKGETFWKPLSGAELNG